MQNHNRLVTRNMLGGAAAAIAVVAAFAWFLGWPTVQPLPHPLPQPLPQPTFSTGAMPAPIGPSALVPAQKLPPRIVALSPGLTETLRRIGAGATIVGRHGFDAWTDPAIPVCGDQGGIDAEMLRRANPTHLYLQWGDKQLPSSIESTATDLHWTVRNFTLLSLDQIQAAAAAMYTDVRTKSTTPSARAALGVDAETFADSVVGKLWQTATAQRTGKAANAFSQIGPVILLFSDRDPVAAAGPGSYHHEILARLGCRQAITTGAAYQVLDRETLRRLNPAIAIVLKPRKPGATFMAPQSTAAAATDKPATDQPTLRRTLGLDESGTTRVIIIDDPLAFVPGLNLTDFIAQLEKRLPNP